MDPDAVIPHQMHIRHRNVLGHRLRIQQPFASRLRLAVRARACEPQLARRPHIFGLVLPDKANFALSEPDDLEGHGHAARIVPPWFAVNVVRTPNRTQRIFVRRDNHCIAAYARGVLRSRSLAGGRRISRLSGGHSGDVVRSTLGMTSDNKVQFLDRAEIERGLAEVAELAKAQGIGIALIGGVALQLLGSMRFTKDIDFIVGQPLEGVRQTGVLGFGGIKATTASGVPVDLVIRDDDYRVLYETAVERATAVRGVPVPVVPAEYLIAMKMVAGRPKDDADLEFLIADANVDRARARAVIKEHLGPYAADEFDRYCDEVEWRRSRDAE